VNKLPRLSLGPGYEQFPSSPGGFHTAGSGLIPQRSKSDSHRRLLGTLAPYGQNISETLRRSAGQTGAMAKPPAQGAERHCKARQTCQGCRYSGKGERAARGHFPPPQRGSYRALDALGLRRVMGVSPVRRKKKQRQLPRYGSKALWTCYNFPCSYLLHRLRGPRLGVGEPAMPWR